MGFPDTFTWDHDTQMPQDMYRQIGNAAAIPVGRALGRELLKVLIEMWESAMPSEGPGVVPQSIDTDDDEDLHLLASPCREEGDGGL